MRDLPLPFHTDPARALALGPDDARFTGPDRLAREVAEATVDRDDVALAMTLSRAWRSGAPDELLEDVLCSYARAHELDGETLAAIDTLARFAPAGGDLPLGTEYALLAALRERALSGLQAALEAAQDADEPCWCVACVAEAAELN